MSKKTRYFCSLLYHGYSLFSKTQQKIFLADIAESHQPYWLAFTKLFVKQTCSGKYDFARGRFLKKLTQMNAFTWDSTQCIHSVHICNDSISWPIVQFVRLSHWKLIRLKTNATTCYKWLSNVWKSSFSRVRLLVLGVQISNGYAQHPHLMKFNKPFRAGLVV